MQIEMMSESIDETLDKDEAEEETEELTNQVLDEIGVDIASQVGFFEIFWYCLNFSCVFFFCGLNNVN
jgi:hypothetical protein